MGGREGEGPAPLREFLDTSLIFKGKQGKVKSFPRFFGSLLYMTSSSHGVSVYLFDIDILDIYLLAY